GTNGSSVFNFNGGLLKAKGPHGAFMSGLTTATVQSAGAFIDDSGYNLTIAQSLLDGGGTPGGFTQIGTGSMTTTGTNTYNGATAIMGGRFTASAAMTGTGAVSVVDTAILRVTGADTHQWAPSTLSLGSSSGATVEFNAISNSNVPPLNVGVYNLGGV